MDKTVSPGYHFLGKLRDCCQNTNPAICTYCMVEILERQMKLERNIYEVMSILGSSLLLKEHLKDLLKPDPEPEKPVSNQWILPLEFD